MKLMFSSIILCLFSAGLYAQHSQSEIISYVTTIELDRGKSIKTDSVVLQINERAGDEDAEIFIHYSKGESVSNITAWLEDADGNIIRRLKKNDIKERNAISNSSLYQDYFIKSFDFKHSTYPYRILYTYKLTSDRRLSLYDFQLYDKPVRSAKVVVNTLLPIVYRQKYIDEPQKQKGADNKDTYIWQFSYDGYTPEINALYDVSSNFPELKIQPLNFTFVTYGSFDSWQSYGNWDYAINEGRDQLPDSEKEIINKLLSSITDNKEKAKVLYKYLQDNTRYINVNIKYGGLQSYPAEYVCTNRYGDCKALTNYMKSILNYAGIQSYYTSVYSGERFPVIYPDYPDVSAFNYVILTIPFGNDTTYLECTSKNNPFGYISTSIQGRKALLADKTNSRLVDIPELKPEDVVCVNNIVIDIYSENDANILLDQKLKGIAYELNNDLSKSMDKATVDRFTRDFIRGNMDLIDYKISKPDPDKAQINASYKFTQYGTVKRYGNNMILKPFLINTLPDYEKSEDRKYGVKIDYPKNQIDTITYKFADAAVISKIPSDISIQSKYGEYSIEFEMKDNCLFIYKHILINRGEYLIEEYNDFYNFILQIRNTETKNIYIELL